MVAGKRTPDDHADLKRAFQAAVACWRQVRAQRRPYFAGARQRCAGRSERATAAASMRTGPIPARLPAHKQDDPSEPRSEQLYRAARSDALRSANAIALETADAARTLASVGAPVQCTCGRDDTSCTCPKRRADQEQVNTIFPAIEAWDAQDLGTATSGRRTIRQDSGLERPTRRYKRALRVL